MDALFSWDSPTVNDVRAKALTCPSTDRARTAASYRCPGTSESAAEEPLETVVTAVPPSGLVTDTSYPEIPEDELDAPQPSCTGTVVVPSVVVDKEAITALGGVGTDSESVVTLATAVRADSLPAAS